MSLQRRLPRHVLWDTLVYVNLDHANGGIILNLNEHGMAVQAAAPVRAQSPVRVNFQLPGTCTFVETTGEVCWASDGQAGIQFVGLADVQRRKLNEALLDSLLTRCAVAHGVTPEPEPRPAGAAAVEARSVQEDRAEGTPSAIPPEPVVASIPHTPARRATMTRRRESVLLLAGTSLFAAAFLLTAEVPAEAGMMLLAGMAVPCVLLAVLHQLVELQERE